MVYAVFYPGDTVPQSVLCLLPGLPLDDGDTEGGGKEDHGEKSGGSSSAEMSFAEKNTYFIWTNGKGYTT